MAKSKNYSTFGAAAGCPQPTFISAQPCSRAYLINSDEDLIVQDIEVVQIIAWRIQNDVAYPILASEVDGSCADVLPIDDISGSVVHPIHGSYDCICDVIDCLYMGITEEFEMPA